MYVLRTIYIYCRKIVSLQKLQGRQCRQACLREIFQPDLCGLSNAETKVRNASSESEIRGGAGRLRGHCNIEQQEGPGPLSGLHHVGAPGPKDPFHSFLRRWQHRSDFLRRGWRLLVAQNPATDAGFRRQTLACSGNHEIIGKDLETKNDSKDFVVVLASIVITTGTKGCLGSRKDSFHTQRI